MFTNEPLIDFSLESNRTTFKAKLSEVQNSFLSGPIKVPAVIEGKEEWSSEYFERLSPNDGKTRIANVSLATEGLADRALRSVSSGFSSWSRASVSARIDCLQRTAEILSEDRLRLAAIIVHEAGKPWKEADADVAEAIDFCRYYAIEMRKLSVPQLTMPVQGEENFYFYEPRGVALVISPWNFPLAIAAGMTVAALVAGNTVILKPAENTSLIAYEFAKALLKAGIPENAFALLTGRGSVIGRKLVKDPGIALICFTGSKEVGLEIMRNASELQPGQRSIKKVIAELGGKNAIVVDSDADLDETVKGVLYSTFGYAGQKCSACSRLIAVGAAYEPLLERLAEAARSMVVGPATDPGVTLGPVIDRTAQQRIASVIERHKNSVPLAFQGTAPEHGFLVAPVIFRDVPLDHDLWRTEIFGPVLSANKAETFEQAIQMANDCEYALTGGLFSRSPANIERGKREFKVGNLYINRGCTGALVCRQPFGGFKMSGVGSKAGGPDYLLQFLEPRTVTENTMRRGFTPAT